MSGILCFSVIKIFVCIGLMMGLYPVYRRCIVLDRTDGVGVFGGQKVCSTCHSILCLCGVLGHFTLFFTMCECMYVFIIRGRELTMQKYSLCLWLHMCVCVISGYLCLRKGLCSEAWYTSFSVCSGMFGLQTTYALHSSTSCLCVCVCVCMCARVRVCL